jgi:osmotically-inducible protein OsmY
MQKSVDAGEEVKMRFLGDDMRMRVLNALHWDLAIPRDRLNVDVENGWVTVSGTVDLPYQKTCAECDARNVPGVVGVTNLIRLAGNQWTKPQPGEVAQLRH